MDHSQDKESTDDQKPAIEPCVELILFLDLDEMLQPSFVLHEQDGRSIAKPYNGPKGIYIPELRRILSPYLRRIEIVISSWSACDRSLDAVRAALPEEVARRIADKIYLEGLEADYRSDLATRYESIALWLSRRRAEYAGPWLALDRDILNWPTEALHHLISPTGTLGDRRTQDELSRRLAQALSGPS